MSQRYQEFQDNFARDNDDDKLDYDESAFYFYSFTMLSVFLAPLLFMTLWRVFKG